MSDVVKEYEERTQRMLTKEWVVGFKDRGMGHGDYGVVIPVENELSDEELEKLSHEELKCYFSEVRIPELVIPNIPRELAEHLVELHNKSLA